MGKGKLAFTLIEVLVSLAILSLVILFVVPAFISITKLGTKNEQIMKLEKEAYGLANFIYSKKFEDVCLKEGEHCKDDNCCQGFDSRLYYSVEDINSQLKKITVRVSNSDYELIFLKGKWK